MTTAIEPPAFTVQHCLEEAVICCEAGWLAEFDGRPGKAVLCYAEAEGWLWKADKLRGCDKGRPVLDARLEIERAMGSAN